MISALFKAFLQFSDARFRAVVVRALLWSLALFAVLFAGLWWLIVSTRLFGIDWLESVVDVLGWGAALVAAILLFPGAVMAVLGFMTDEIAAAVEARHYPDLAPARRQPLGEAVIGGVRLAALVVVLNLLALPLYLIPVLNVFVFYALNGYLLGREYFELVAVRRLDAGRGRALWRRYRGRLCVAGVIITVLLSLPLVAWLMPAVAVAFMVHLFETVRRAESPA